MKRLGNLFLVSLLSGATTLGAYKLLFDSELTHSKPIVTTAPDHYATNVGFSDQAVDFTDAADKAIHTVVHVKNLTRRTVNDPILEFFYGYKGGQQQEQIGTGSGVIISEDGYIVTNNHVIQDATELEITLNDKRSYKAKLIGTDAKMDIALLKIEPGEKLPYCVFADSDATKVGQWVLAVGNPYNLTSTVTAGIISAKARNLGGNGIQSFIQTDAAVNPGNSGGALVNTHGELVGINTMISSQTGSYVGYSFAVPSNITRKIIADIMEFGTVQRGVLGVEGTELNSETAKQLNIKPTQGFYVKKINKNSGAEKSDLKTGDIITKLDNQNISSFADLSGYINTKRPNDKIQITYIRNDKTMTTSLTLSKNSILETDFKGLELVNATAEDKKKFKINYGVKIKSINNDKLTAYANDLKDGVILSIAGAKADDIETVSKIISNLDESQSVQIEMITQSGQVIRLIL